MSEPRTVLEHLLGSRDALVLEVERLAVAIEALDSVIVRIAGEGRRPAALQITSGASLNGSGATGTEPTVPGGFDSLGDIETETSRPVSSAARPAKKTARKAGSATARKTAKATTPPQKSIRVHVLEMLAAEDRDFSLAEIIDRIHAEGIQAHDDAVRSITIKLMKDGRIERPSRGLYRLARRGRSAQNAPTPVPAAPPVASDPEPSPETPAPAETPVDYTPPLNLGQPWDRRS